MTSITFSEVIHEDHSTINNCARNLKDAKSLEAKRMWRDEVAWRLVRHDISEEIVMRPAFEKYMGIDGIRILEEDRQDHQHAKTDLIKLSQLKLDSLEFETFLEAMLAKLLEHMRRESGQHIPRLEKMISREVSASLARDYLRTQLMTPFLCKPNEPDSRYFTKISDYLDAPLSRFIEILQTLSSCEDGARTKPLLPPSHSRHSSKM